MIIRPTFFNKMSVNPEISSAKASSKNALASQYKKMTQHEHILNLPDTYIGSVEKTSLDLWVNDGEKMVYKTVEIPPGLYKIFDEIIVNAIDHHVRLKEEMPDEPQVSQIRVNLEQDTGRITVYNNGRGIDVEQHPEHKIYIPEMIMGHLLTSGNYEKKNKKTGGKNGYGAKLTNIYSKEFILETVDHTRKKKYENRWTENMRKSDGAKITKSSVKPYTKISFIPDYKRFGIDGLTDDLMQLFRKRVYDCTACTDKALSVYLNDVKIEVKEFEKYVDLYLGDKKDTPRVFEKVNDNWEVAVAVSSDDKFEQISFVNGICTFKGGKHVENVSTVIANRLVKFMSEKKKGKADIKATHIKDNMSLFVKCSLCDPDFESQTKDYMTTPASKFSTKFDVSDDFIKKLSKIGICEKAMSLGEYKNKDILKKTDGSKKRTIKDIPKLEDANFAGTSKSNECVLILTEGDSAKAFAVSGLSVLGRDRYGVFPLRGKMLNPRDVETSKILKNAEITALKTIIGLQDKKVYTEANIGELRYGAVMLLTDQDVDGSHIKGLLMNMFHYFWPSLLEIKGFIKSIATPIVKVRKGKEVISFFTLTEFEKWEEQNNGGKGWDIKYYKGLGTSDSKEAKEIFKDVAEKEILYPALDKKETDDAILLAFGKEKDRANGRKGWLSEYDRNIIIEQSQKLVPIPDFINKDLIHFSNYDNIRSIPSMCDGLKPSQRKILFSCFKRNLKKEIKVAQLAGYVSENSAYHHGEQSLASAIVGMAQDFVGTNNINMLLPAGQFGTRLAGGTDFASPRYLFTRMMEVLPVIFNEMDNKILKNQEEDGMKIEPEYYVPIIPMALVNGSMGIGTGYSTNIPCFNPVDIVANLRRKLNGEEFIEMLPWYRDFDGEIKKDSTGKIINWGIWKRLSDTSIEITELPLGLWTDDYKEYLEKLIIDKTTEKKEQTKQVIIGYDNYSTERKVRFVIKMTKDKLDKLIKNYEVEKTFKMFDTKRTNMGNMHMYNADGKICLYKTELEVMEDYYKIRLEMYVKRKRYMIEKMKYDVRTISARAKFITAVIDNVVDLRMKTDEEVDEQLVKLELPKLSKLTYEEDDEHNKKKEPSYDYLTSMPLRSLTKKRVDELMREKGDIESNLNLLEASTEKDMWLDDLDSFETVYEKMINEFCEKNEMENKTSSKLVSETGKGRNKKSVGKTSSSVKSTGIKIKVSKKT